MGYGGVQNRLTRYFQKIIIIYTERRLVKAIKNSTIRPIMVLTKAQSAIDPAAG